jgi:CRP-like cAMP-binding protein
MNAQTASSFDLLENVIFLKKTPLFAGAQTGDLRAVAAVAEELSVEAGSELVKENEIGDCVYIIKEGSVRVTKKTSDDKAVDLAEFSAGECFGEMALFDDEARSASVVAQTRCALLRIKRDDLIDVLLDYPTIAIELLRIFVGRLRKSNTRIEALSGARTKGQSAQESTIK